MRSALAWCRLHRHYIGLLAQRSGAWTPLVLNLCGLCCARLSAMCACDLQLDSMQLIAYLVAFVAWVFDSVKQEPQAEEQQHEHECAAPQLVFSEFVTMRQVSNLISEVGNLSVSRLLPQRPRSGQPQGRNVSSPRRHPQQRLPSRCPSFNCW